MYKKGDKVEGGRVSEFSWEEMIAVELKNIKKGKLIRNPARNINPFSSSSSSQTNHLPFH